MVANVYGERFIVVPQRHRRAHSAMHLLCELVMFAQFIHELSTTEGVSIEELLLNVKEG